MVRRVKIKSVNMDDMAFVSDSKTKLLTEGVSTCIAFIIRGTFWYDDTLLSFCGLYHWSGFPLTTTDPTTETINTLNDFFENLREELEVDSDSYVTISELAFAGGEKRHIDEVSGEILLSGTEREVEYLYHLVRQFDFESQLLRIEKANINHHHFITSGEQSLTITVDLNAWQYKVEEPELNEEQNLSFESRSRSFYI